MNGKNKRTLLDAMSDLEGELCSCERALQMTEIFDDLVDSEIAFLRHQEDSVYVNHFISRYETVHSLLASILITLSGTIPEAKKYMAEAVYIYNAQQP